MGLQTEAQRKRSCEAQGPSGGEGLRPEAARSGHKARLVAKGYVQKQQGVGTRLV